VAPCFNPLSDSSKAQSLRNINFIYLRNLPSGNCCKANEIKKTPKSKLRLDRRKKQG